MEERSITSIIWKREVFIYCVLEERSVITEEGSMLLSRKREVFSRKREVFYGRGKHFHGRGKCFCRREKCFHGRWKVSIEKRACPCEASVLIFILICTIRCIFQRKRRRLGKEL